MSYRLFWRISSVLFGCFSVLIVANAQIGLLQNVYNRDVTYLAGDWHYIVDPYENGYYNYRYEPFDQQESPWASAFFLNSKRKGPTDLLEYDFDKMDTLAVPGDWNSQRPELFYYEGTVWYKRSFDYELSELTNRLFVYFEAANYKAEVYFNGQKLGTHYGGFTPFNFEITDLLQAEGNFLVLKVDNKRTKEGVPTLNTDWWNYGGLTREVKLIETPATFIADYQIQLAPNNNKRLTGYVQLSGANAANQKITLELLPEGVSFPIWTDKNGMAELSVMLKNIRYWHTDDPYLYQLRISTASDELTDQLGLRTITVLGDQILLNGDSLFLKGISIHEERPYGGGRAHSEAHARQLLQWAKDLGCNYVRLAHYPHNEHMVRLADEWGMLVWEENPVYWTIDWENEHTYQVAQQQLLELISRDKNRASVIIWSMANETPNTPARNTFLSKLAAFARATDGTRLISAALEQKDYQGNPDIRTIDDPFAEVVDILSFNQYIGWYDGLPEKCRRISWQIEQDKPVLISEFGAGAKHGLHGDINERWTEEFQANLYTETLQMLDRIDRLRGFSPWILVDFRSPRRVLPDIQDGWNRKGLISEAGEKKLAFEILRKYYNQLD